MNPIIGRSHIVAALIFINYAIVNAVIFIGFRESYHSAAVWSSFSFVIGVNTFTALDYHRKMRILSIAYAIVGIIVFLYFALAL
ncbi:hypothetical protein [Glycocaulis sp.]|uniref:hypothetical protein n=1 Tax=Glycocaulis sp. TaxID=1969725 RepID=UPI003F7161E6